MVSIIKKWSAKFVNQSDLLKIQTAIAHAELKTSAEIVPLIIRKSSTIQHVPILLFTVALLCCFGVGVEIWPPEETNFFELYMIVSIIFSLGFAFIVAKFDFAQRWLTSDFDKSHQVANRAELEFYRCGVTATRDATGVLIFISLMERRVEIVADRAISQVIENKVWEELVATLIGEIKKGQLVQGLLSCIESCGHALNTSFPIKDNDINELKNHPILLD